MKTKQECIKAYHEGTLIEYIDSILAIRDATGEIVGWHGFNMSGYNSNSGIPGIPGSCVTHNIEILLKFAHMGIYDHVSFLYSSDCE